MFVIAFMLGAFLGLASAGGADRAVGAMRSGAMVVPEIPKLEILNPSVNSIPALSQELSIPQSGALELPASPAGLASPNSPVAEPAKEGPAVEGARPRKQDDMAMPELESLGEDVKPGAAFTEHQFSQKFDGLKEYRAPIAIDEFDLSAIDPSDTGKIKGEKQAKKKLAKDQIKLNKLQETLYADQKHKVLIVLQGMDTAGKDGVIKHVMRSLNPQGVQVHSFKKPSDEEKRHHYLWRIANALPGKGMIGIFNRSQYEEILVPSVHPEWNPGMTAKELDARYDTMNAFEKELAQKGWTIMKFYLHISKDEQKARLQDRIDTPEKNWKFSESDLAERRFWDKYRETYEKILARTNTPWAPWYVIPANNKWYRDYLIGKIVKKTLKSLKLKNPPPNPKLKGLKIPD